METFLRAYVEKRAEDDNPESPVRFVASTEGVKRDGLDLKSDRWMLDNYRKHPVVLFAHDYFGHNLPIGTGEPKMDGKSLLIDVRFDNEDDFAMKVRRKAVKGMLAGSVGWDNVEVDGDVRYDLLEFSIVPVPADPDALPARARSAFDALQRMFAKVVDDEDDSEEDGDEEEELVPAVKRGAIAPHTTDKAPEDASWDGPAEVAKADGEAKLRIMHAWVNDEAEPDAKGGYKLPHHTAEAGQVVWSGVRAAMARLFQADTQIPDKDREGVWRHLSRHYRQFDKEPPEFRTAADLAKLTPDQIRGLFLEGEADMNERIGAVLSGRNRGDLEQAVALIQGVIERAKKEEPEDEERKVETEADKLLQTIHGLFKTTPTR